MKRGIARWKSGLGVLLMTGLCGCATRIALQQDYSNFSEVYGDAVNKQLLLNLAREAHQEPAYFIQLASISSQYQFTGGAGFNPSFSRTAPAFAGIATAQRVLTFGASANAGITQTPIFQFVPLTGSNYVQGLLTPFTEKVFWTFYDQGWPANLVARTMLSSIQKITGEIYVTNFPPEGQTNAPEVVTNYDYDVYLNDPTDPTYPEFLKYCNDFHNAQLFHILSVDKGKAEEGAVVFQGKNASLPDLAAAVNAGFSVKYDPVTRNYVVRKAGERVNFLDIRTNEDALIQRYYTGNGTFTRDEAMTCFDRALEFAKNYEAGKIKLTTRTFEEAMNAVANEQGSFDGLANKTNAYSGQDIMFTKDPYGTIARVRTGAKGELEFPVRPILMMRYPAEERGQLSKAAQVAYEGEVYTIGDLEDTDRDPLAKGFHTPNWTAEVRFQNRTVFSMMSYLFSQTAIDTSKFPIQQLIQVQ